MKTIFLIGKPHVGKTTTLQMLCVFLLFRGARVVVHRYPVHGSSRDFCLEIEIIINGQLIRVAICTYGDIPKYIAQQMEIAQKNNCDVFIGACHSTHNKRIFQAICPNNIVYVDKRVSANTNNYAYDNVADAIDIIRNI